jgi:hypothetical protein
MHRARLHKALAAMAIAVAVPLVAASCGGDEDGSGGTFKIAADADQFAGPAPLISRFKASARNAKGEVGYYWRFDDGTTSKEQNPTHRFTKAGYYTVIVDARDEEGRNDRQTFLLGAWTPEEWSKARRTPLTAERAKNAQRLQSRRTNARLRQLRQVLDERAREQTQG